MRILLFVVLAFLSFSSFADARAVEAPSECHFPYDNNNVDNEYKLLGCIATLRSDAGGNVYNAGAFVRQEKLNGGLFIINGEDVRIVDDYPSGKMTVRTSGVDSGQTCNIVDAGGTTYSTANWSATTTVYRRTEKWFVDVEYELDCWGATQAQ